VGSVNLFTLGFGPRCADFSHDWTSTRWGKVAIGVARCAVYAFGWLAWRGLQPGEGLDAARVTNDD